MAKRFFYVCTGVLLLALVYHLGARNVLAQLPSPGEVAILTGVLDNGGVIPLPTYADGTVALASECHWIVSPAVVTFVDPSGNLNMVTTNTLTCTTTDRVVSVASAGYAGGSGGAANYMIVAVRGSGSPTANTARSWGSVKARYRGERQPATRDR